MEWFSVSIISCFHGNLAEVHPVAIIVCIDCLMDKIEEAAMGGGIWLNTNLLWDFEYIDGVILIYTFSISVTVLLAQFDGSWHLLDDSVEYKALCLRSWAITMNQLPNPDYDYPCANLSNGDAEQVELPNIWEVSIVIARGCSK